MSLRHAILSSVTIFLLPLAAAAQESPPPIAAPAQERWIITDFTARSVDSSSVATFHDLLRDEIQTRNGVQFGSVAMPCDDSECATRAAVGTGATHTVHGSVNRLGQKLIVSVSVVEVPSARVTFSQRMSIDRVEELDIVAERMAQAIVVGGSAADDAELGTITHQEATAPRRRETRVAALWGMQMLAPMHGYAGRPLGAGVAVGMLIETVDFVIEPSVSYRFDTDTSDDQFDHGAFDLAAAYLFSRGDISLMAGAGIGLHWLSEDVHVQRSVGRVLRSTSRDLIHDSVVGFSMFPRLGVMFLRTYDVSLQVTVDYALTFADFQERSTEHGLRLGVSLVLGGS